MRDEGVNLDRESDGLAMETPERKQQISSTPVPKFEDSPVFNFLNSLSPIEPVKSLHITQTLNSLNCSSPPSVFTSPHVSSLKESRFLRRHVFPDPSKLEFSSENGDKVGRNEDVVNTAHNSTEQQQTSEPGSSTGESSRAIENSRTLRYDCASPDCDLATRSCMKAKFLPEVTGSSTALVPCVQIESGKSFFGSEVHTGGTSHIAEIKESEGCDWENLLSDSADLLVFDSPNLSKSLEGHSQKSLEPGTSFGTSLTENLENTGAAEAVCQSQQHLIDDSQHEDGSDVNKIAENEDILVSLSDCMAGDADLKVDDELASNLHRGMRRRCLVFEIPGSRQKILGDDSNCGPSVSSQSHDNFASNDKRTVPIRLGNDTRRRSLPGIGLHLNALAATPVDPKVVKTISVSRPAACFSSSNSQETLNNSLLVISSEKDMPPPEGGVPTVEDADQASGYADNEAFDHSSLKKKRRRSENGEESGDCKRCNCKKSKCLKLYCECFAAGVYCVEPCSCQDCFNKPIHVDIVLATRKQIETRNPLAFAPKVIRSSDSVIEAQEESRKTPASARHKRGCNCKKSGCLKKYCECFQGGVGCSNNCRCEGCKNAFGRKDGTEVEFEEEEVPEGEKSVADKRLQMSTDQNKAEQITNFALSATPLHSIRQSNQLPLSSTSKRPPRSFFAIGSSSGLRFGRLTPLPPPPTMLEKQNIQNVNVQEDDMPEILLQRNDGGSPISGVKSASPNSKRVSPPHGNNIGVLSPVAGQRSSRKLILQSIPSFPSLTPPKH